MSYSIHIIRKTEDGQEMPITLDEWNAYIDADYDLKRPEPLTATAALLPLDGDALGEWQTLLLVSGSILSDYAQESMLKKIAQIARHFDAVVMSDDGDDGDDGDVWQIDQDGRVTIDRPASNRSDPKPLTSRKPIADRMGSVWPYFNYDQKTDPRRIIIWLLGWKSDADHNKAAKCITNRLQIPSDEASAAIRACQSRTPVGLPGPEDIEELCGICEMLEGFGIEVTGCGVAVPPWK
jgi:hypothetical protein